MMPLGAAAADLPDLFDDCVTGAAGTTLPGSGMEPAALVLLRRLIKGGANPSVLSLTQKWTSDGLNAIPQLL